MARTVERCLEQSLPVLLLVLLAEGQTVQVPGTDLTITATSIRDLASEGCLGGPVGCLDTVQLKITRDNLDQKITLSVAQTEIHRSREINRTKVFDHQITFGTPLPVVEWETGTREQRSPLVRVQTRPSLLYSRLFAALGDFAKGVELILLAMASTVFCPPLTESL